MDFIRRNDINLGLKLVGKWPRGQDPTPENVDTWLSQQLQSQQPAGRRFRNYRSHFLLDWTEPDIPDAQYALRDADLQLIAFPEVQSPYKFPESIYRRDTKPQPPSGFVPPSGSQYDYPEAWNQERFIIRPPLFKKEDLSLVNTKVKIRKVLPSTRDGSVSSLYFNYGQPPSGEIQQLQVNTAPFAVRIYAENSPSGEIPLQCVNHGSIHNVPSGTKLMVAPDLWMAENDINKVYGPDQGEHLNALGLGVEMFKYDDPHWSWYRWDDGDFWRLKFQDWFQEDRIPSQGEGYNLLLNNVNGMSLGGNNNNIWIDPVYLANISKVNHHRLFREVSHCYKTDKCNYGGANGEVFLIHDPLQGFRKDKTAQLDGSGKYCRYRQDPPDAGKISRFNKKDDWDYYCKYLGVPQRAVEYDGNYTALLNEILVNFREQGILFWTQNNGPFKEENLSLNNYILKATAPVSIYDFGQLRYFNGGISPTPVPAGVIPSGTAVFHYTVPAPVTDPEVDPGTYDTELAAHIKSRLFAKVFQFNDIDNIPQGTYEQWLVELLNDYISPVMRISEFETVEEFKGGDNPFIKDERFRGFLNNGLRLFMIRDPDTQQWIPKYPYELVPSGFYNLVGGNVTVDGGFSGLDEVTASFAPPELVNNPSETVVNIKGVLAKGRIRAWGLPGEVVTRKIVAWKQPTVIKWLHIQELKDRLEKFSDMSTGLLPSMQEYAEGEEPNQKTGVVKIPTPNHILQGSIDGSGNRQIIGTGMVSNGDTPFSDIFLFSDILHTRNLCLPMLAYKLTTGLPSEPAEYFDESVQDIMSRKTEPRSLSIQRHGFREPSIYTFMRNFINNNPSYDEVSYNLWVPRWFGDLGSGEIGQNIQLDSFGVDGLSGEFIGFSPTDASGNQDSSTNVIFKVFHPNGMGWWRDTGMLGAGLQWGTAGLYELGARGNGLKQEGVALVNFFRRNIPLDKEIAACYLRIVPTGAVEVGSQLVRTAGGGRQYTRSNRPFLNVGFDSAEFIAIQDDLRAMNWHGRIQDQEAIIWQEENQGSLAGFNYNEQNSFGEAYEASKTILGEYNMAYQNFFAGNSVHQMTKPPGIGDESLWVWQRLDPEKTLAGHTLNDIKVVVSANNASGNNVTREFNTGARSRDWYAHVSPQFLRGRHSYAAYDGLGTRLDYDEGGNVDSPNNGRGYGFACASGGWAKDWRVFDITDIARLAYAQDRFTANYIVKVTAGVAELPSTDLALIEKETESELADIPITERVLDYTGNISSISGLFEDPPSAEANTANEDGFIIITISLKQKIKPRQITGSVTSEAIEGTPTEDKLRKNYIPQKFTIKILGGQEYIAGPIDSASNPNYFLVMARSFNAVDRDQSGWRYIYSEKWSATSPTDENTFEFEYPEGKIEQFREVRVITNANAVKEFKVDGKYAKDDPQIAPITSPPLSELHDINKSIQEHVLNSNSGITKFTILPIKHPATKVYRVTLIPGTSKLLNGLKFIQTTEGVLTLSFDGEFKPFNPPKFKWEFINGEWRITEGTYQYSSAFNAIVIPPTNHWIEQETEDGISPQYMSAAKLEDVLVSIVYSTGRGSSVETYIEAENTGPAYDVDPESIITITENGLSKLKNPSIIDPDFYGTPDQLIPYSVTNKNELQSGYIRGVLPETGHAFFLTGPFQSPLGILNEGWKTKCRGLLTVYGEPNMEIIGGVEVAAPDFVTHTDPVTGQPLSNGFKFTSGLDATKKPNGGRKPASLFINMQIGGNAFQNPSGNENDPTFRKKQVAFYPEVYVYLRERVDWLNLGDTTFGLSFEVQ